MAIPGGNGPPDHGNTSYYSSNASEKSDGGTMDDLQFHASLAALLDSENLSDEASGSPSYFSPNPVIPGTTATGLHNSAVASSNPAQAQGLLTTSGTVGTISDSMVFALPNLPYSVTATNSTQPSLAALALAYAPAPFTILPTPTATAPGNNVVLSTQHHQPILPSAPVSVCAEPAVSSSSVASAPPNSTTSRKRGSRDAKALSTSRKRLLDVTAVSEDEEDSVRRRQDRNVREQQRSQKITQQIDHLREVLASADIPFKADKYSTLVTVADYIKELQLKSARLDSEHKKLIDTILKTNEMVNDQYVPASTNGQNPPGSGLDLGASPDKALGADGDAVFVPNIDYKSCFSRCGIPLAVLSIDGRFLDCNGEFERLVGYGREELLPRETLALIADETPSNNTLKDETLSVDDSDAKPSANPTNPSTTRNLSLFNLLSREHMEGVFLAMSEMLKHPPEKEPVASKEFWTGHTYLSRNPEKKVSCDIYIMMYFAR